MSPSDISTQRPGAMGRLAEWGVVEIIGDYRAAKIVQEVYSSHVEVGPRQVVPGPDATIGARVYHHRTRHAFTSECIDCGAAPHVSPDDHTIAVCLRCGRDKWL